MNTIKTEYMILTLPRGYSVEAVTDGVRARIAVFASKTEASAFLKTHAA